MKFNLSNLSLHSVSMQPLRFYQVINACFWLLSGILAIGLSSCDRDDESLTEQLNKVETNYSQVGKTPSSNVVKKETLAPDWYLKKVEAEFNELMIKRNSGRVAAVGDYDIGYVVNNNGTCFGEKISFYMDCEDSAPETDATAYGSFSDFPWTIYNPSNTANSAMWGDILMTFCRADGLTQGLSGTYTQEFAVLKLGPLNLPGSTTIKRRFDNEDSGNQNWTSGSIAPNYENGNTALYFSAFSAGGSKTPPRKVFAASPTDLHRFKYFIDDEDSNNANYWTINGSQRSSFRNTYFDGGANTTMWIQL